MPDFSVIIATHRRPAFLARALRSIKVQTLRDIQVIVVSDAPCVQTADVAGKLLGNGDLFMQRHDVPGPAASRNLGLHVADGDFIAFLDDDDAWTETFFADVRPHVGPSRIVYTDFHAVHERFDGVTATPLGAAFHPLGDRVLADLFVKNFIPLHCLVYPAALAKACVFDASLEQNEDWEFLLQAVERAQDVAHCGISGPVVYSRERADNRSRTNTDLLESVYRRIYGTHAAPSDAIRGAREMLLAAARGAEMRGVAA